LGGGEQLIEEPLAAAGIRLDDRCLFLALGSDGAGHHLLHPAAGLLAMVPIASTPFSTCVRSWARVSSAVLYQLTQHPEGNQARSTLLFFENDLGEGNGGEIVAVSLSITLTSFPERTNRAISSSVM